MECKKHFKLYKSGKQWCCAAVVTLAITTGLMINGGVVHASQSVLPEANVAQTVSNQAAAYTDNGYYVNLDSATVSHNDL